MPESVIGVQACELSVHLYEDLPGGVHHEAQVELLQGVVVQGEPGIHVGVVDPVPEGGDGRVSLVQAVQGQGTWQRWTLDSNALLQLNLPSYM